MAILCHIVPHHTKPNYVPQIKTMETSKFIANTLGHAINSIYDTKPMCEVDPTRVTSSSPENQQKEVAANWKRLMQYTSTLSFEWPAVIYFVEV